jgi:hypothetical protein
MFPQYKLGLYTSKTNNYQFSLHLPSNVYISTTFFRKTLFFFKLCFGNTPWKFLGVWLNSESMWRWIPMRPQKAVSCRCRSYRYFAKLQHIHVEGFHSDMPNIDTFCLINKTDAYHINAFKYFYDRENKYCTNLPFVTISITFLPGKISSE